MNGYVSQYGRNALLIGFIMMGLAGVYFLLGGFCAFAYDIPGMVFGAVAIAIGFSLLVLALSCLLVRWLMSRRGLRSASSAIHRTVRGTHVFSPPSIALATALGAAPAGFLLLALNSLHFGHRQVACLGFLVVVIGVVVVGVMPFYVGLWFTLALWLVQVILLAVLAHRVQGALAASNHNAGGDWASDWSAAGIGFLVAGSEITVLLTRNTVVGLLNGKV
jgi:hypothetical protein